MFQLCLGGWPYSVEPFRGNRLYRCHRLILILPAAGQVVPEQRVPKIDLLMFYRLVCIPL